MQQDKSNNYKDRYFDQEECNGKDPGKNAAEDYCRKIKR